MIDSQKVENIRLKGIGVSPGIILGKAFLVEQGKVEIPTYSLKDKKEIEKEVKTFLHAVELTRNQFLETKKEIKRKGLRKGDFIIDSYLMILEDKLLNRETTNQIRKEKINSAWALKNVRNNLQKIFSEIEDEYLKERRRDLDYVIERILQNLTGKELFRSDKVPEKVIIVAHDLSPADSAHLNLEKVLGFVTDVGGKTSHTAIMARALQIPAVVGLEDITRKVKSGDTIIVDGVSGEVVVNPSPDVFAEYQTKKDKYDAAEKELLKFRSLRAETQDGYYVRLLANIEITEELPSVIYYGAEGIGLYRTEFLYLNRSDLPTEEEQFRTYRQVVEKISPYPTTIRTFDLGGDKFISRVALAQEINPAL
ncbi:MAG: PEP-utilizing enzyme, partial [Desulfobacterota bacterium]|nr:PEP-utilizing enzyme [Thermodesulfobacteriota bacterium]